MADRSMKKIAPEFHIAKDAATVARKCDTSTIPMIPDNNTLAAAEFRRDLGARLGQQGAIVIIERLSQDVLELGQHRP